MKIKLNKLEGVIRILFYIIFLLRLCIVLVRFFCPIVRAFLMSSLKFKPNFGLRPYFFQF